MADELKTPPEKPFSLAAGARRYLIFCVVVIALAIYANRTGFFPTYGLFSGENSMHSSYHHYYGGYGIHGK